MDAVYLICLLVGGFFVALSAFGGADTDAEVDFDVDADVDLDAEFDAGVDADTGSIGGGTGFVDLFSLRVIFLFAAFFGLTGVLLGWVGAGEPLRLIVSLLLGLGIGFGGNYIIKRVGYRHVSSDVGVQDLLGRTAQVTIPFGGVEKGKISLVAKATRMHLIAEAFDDETDFAPGDEVVVVRMRGNVARVIRPD